jgi:hypothetical protein
MVYIKLTAIDNVATKMDNEARKNDDDGWM